MIGGASILATGLARAEGGDWLSPYAALHVLLFLVVSLHSLWHRREATVTLLWMFAAWTLPIVGPLLYLGFGINRVPAKGWKRHHAGQRLLAERAAREDDAAALSYWRAVHAAQAGRPPGEAAGALDRAMSAVLPTYPLLRGNRVEPLITGDEAFPAMLDAIGRARHHVHLQTFIVGRDAIGRRFLDALRAKAREGVAVRFLFDRFGSTHAFLGGMLIPYARMPGLRIKGWTQANPLKRQFQINLRNHRKLLVVDGREAFAGGINLDVSHATRDGRPPTRDYHFRITGPVVQELQYSFLSDWHFMTDEDPDRLLCAEHFPALTPTGEACVRVVNSGPTPEGETLPDVLFAAIGAARGRLLAVTPYLVPPPEIVRALRAAALRGVDVRIVVPEANNHVYAGLAGRALYEDLLTAGVRIFERRPPFMHAKALIVDDVLALVGTANLDARSLRLNYETDLAVFDAGFIDALKRVVLEDIALSREIELTAWRRRPLAQRLAEDFCRLLTPVL